jgi:hypothetical protein
MIYNERVFETDLPPTYVFTNTSTGELIAYFLDQLTGFEARGELQYLGLISESMGGE